VRSTAGWPGSSPILRQGFDRLQPSGSGCRLHFAPTERARQNRSADGSTGSPHGSRRSLIRRLAELGAQVIILDDLSSGVRWNVPSLPGILFVEGDIPSAALHFDQAQDKRRGSGLH